MPLHIPIAQTPSGKLVVPSCSKAEGPFTCLECAQNLILKQGKIKVFHFAHRHLSPDCSGGGESALHKAAKLLVEKYCSRLVFTGKCIARKHSIARQYINGEAKQEYRYDTAKSYSADVAIFENGVISAIVEVCASHATTGDSLESRTACVGVNNVWEISAVEILSRQVELFTTANAVEVHSLLNHEPDGCICKWCPGCDEFHIDPNRVCDMCRCEWDEWVEGFEFLTGVYVVDIGAAYSHLDSIPRWKRGEIPAFEGMVDSRFDECIHAMLDKFHLRFAARELQFAPRDRHGMEFSAKQRLGQMKRSLQVLTPVFTRFSMYVRWKSCFHQMVNEGNFEEAIKHLDAQPEWNDMNHYTDVIKDIYFDSLRLALVLNRVSYIKDH